MHVTKKMSVFSLTRLGSGVAHPQDFFKEATSITARGEMTEEDYVKVQQAMVDSADKWGNSGGTPSKPKQAATPEQEVAKKAKQESQKLLTATQTAVVQYGQKISAATIDPLKQRISTRPWASEALLGIDAGCANVAKLVQDLHATWAAELLTFKQDPEKLQESSVQKLNDAMEAVKSSYNELDSTWLADIRALK